MTTTKKRKSATRKGNGTGKIAAIIIAVILLLSAAMTVVAYGSKGFEDWKVGNWFKSETVQTEPAAETKLSRSLRTVTRTAAEGDEEVTEPAEETDVERQEVFKKTNVMTAGAGSKVQEWLSGKVQGEDYDDYSYVLKLDTSYGDEYSYKFINEEADLGLNLAVAPNASSASAVTYSFTYLQLSSDNSRPLYKFNGSKNTNNDRRYVVISISSEPTNERNCFLGAFDEATMTSVSDISQKTFAGMQHFVKVLFNQNWYFEYTGENPAPSIEETLTVYKNVELKELQVTEEVVFSGRNEITNSNYGKGKDWLNGDYDYDDFRYKISFPTGAGMERSGIYPYFMTGKYGTNAYNYGFFIFGFGGSFPNIKYEAAAAVEISESEPDAVFWNIEITKTQIRFYIITSSGAEDKEQIFVAGTTEYNEFKQYFLADTILVEHNSSSAYIEEIELIQLHHTGVELPLPEVPPKEGYTFVGWYYDELFAIPYDGEPIYEDTVLYAKYEINKYTVTFNTVGDYEFKSVVVEWNTVLEPTAPTLRGYDFLGWYLEDGTEYTDQPITEDITLTAKWQIKKFTVTFYVEGEVYATKEVEYGTKFIDVVEGAGNLRVTSVMTEDGEKPLEAFADTVITEDYTLRAELAGQNNGQDSQDGQDKPYNFFAKYPWIFAAVGGFISVLVAGYFVSVGKKG